MAMAIAKTLLQTIELRSGSMITWREIDALLKRWRPRSALVRSGKIDPMEEEVELFDACPMQVSDEQGKRGLDYLRKLLLRKDGALRNTALIRDQGINDEHRRVLYTLDHFLFVGMAWDHGTHVSRPYPTYRAVSTTGDWFEYIARPWQSGVPPTFGALNTKVQQ